MRAVALAVAAWLLHRAGRKQGQVDGQLDALNKLMAYELGQALTGKRGIR